ncbi:MAG TPA: sensor histidine kinase [Caulobacteraceae bacterium]|nr:sensor histidine kinase [Caulobacteraceae bacterium]
MDETAKAQAQAETRHRLANLLQLLTTLGRMRASRATDPETRRQLNWVVEMIGALALQQQKFLSPGGEDFSMFINEMEPNWRRRCNGRPVSLQVLAEPTPAHDQQASALAVIVNELVANALAHAFPDGRSGQVRVELKRLAEDKAAITIEDDGVGYDPDGVDASKLGLWLVKGLAEHVRGTLSIECAPGVRCRLEFPVTRV